MPSRRIRLDVSDELVAHIEASTIRARTPYAFVVRAIAFLAHTGATLTPHSICEDALALSRTANIHDVTFDDVYDALPEAVKDLQSSDPQRVLERKLGRK